MEWNNVTRCDMNIAAFWTTQLSLIVLSLYASLWHFRTVVISHQSNSPPQWCGVPEIFYHLIITVTFVTSETYLAYVTGVSCLVDVVIQTLWRAAHGLVRLPSLVMHTITTCATVLWLFLQF